MNPKEIKINRVIFILSLIGIFVALYVLQSFLRDAPIVCVNTGCETVRKSPYSYIFSIPIPAFGLVGYTLLAILAFIKTTTEKTKTITSCMKGISLFGTAFVTWFTYMELFIIKGVCTWCAISAMLMISIFILLYTPHTILTHENNK